MMTPDPGEPAGQSPDAATWHVPGDEPAWRKNERDRRARVLQTVAEVLIAALPMFFGVGFSIGLKSHDVTLMSWMAGGFLCLITSASLIRWSQHR